MRVATFNVNSIKKRIPIVQKWLAKADIDILALQELKCVEEQFPRQQFVDLGYSSLIAGQKAYNGVALVSRRPLDLIEDKLPGDDEDIQARWILAKQDDVFIASVYCPNGNPYPGSKFDYKLAWMDRLEKRLKGLLDDEVPLIVVGDFNIVPFDHDCYDLAALSQDAIAQPKARARYFRLTDLGLTDAWTACHGKKEGFTYWDYQGRKVQTNQGLRIDHALLSPRLADRLTHCIVDLEPRGEETPSDHTPLIVSLDD